MQDEYVPHFKEIFQLIYDSYLDSTTDFEDPLRTVLTSKAASCFKTLKTIKKEGLLAPYVIKLIHEDIHEALSKALKNSGKKEEKRTRLNFEASDLLATFLN